MQKRSSHLSYFIVLLFFSLLIFSLSKLGFLKPIEPLFQTILSPVQASVFRGFSFFTGIFVNDEFRSLEKQNTLLTKQIIAQDKLIEDNKALRDQFQTQNPKSTRLLPAQIIGAPGFIPGASVPETYTLDKGQVDQVKVGDAVVIADSKNNAINNRITDRVFIEKQRQKQCLF